VFVAGSSLFGCADDSKQPGDEPRPTQNELLEFYTRFCEHWEGCVPNFAAEWSSVQQCAEFQVEGYDKLPTACLNRVVDLHECVMDSECASYGEPDPTCPAEREAIKAVDCGGMSAP